MNQHSITARKLALASALTLAAWCAAPSQAALTSLNDEPLATQAGTSTAPPNLMFVIDDSGSMDWDFMPGSGLPGDLVQSPVSDESTYGYRAAQCNGLAYDPTQTYDPPPKWDGSLYPAATYTAVWDDGFTPAPPGSTGGRGGSGGFVALASNALLSYSTGSKSITLDSGQNANLSNGSTIVVRDSNDSSRWMLGTVTNASVTTTKTCAIWDFLCLLPTYTYANTYSFNVSFFTGKNGASNSNWQVFSPSTSNLGTVTYYTYSGSQPRMGWSYLSSGVAQGNPDLTTTFAKECLSHPNLLSGEPGDSLFTAVTLSTTGSSAEAVAARQNYANWYQYYRQRLLLMKTATGKAVLTIPTTYRVGITKISHAFKPSLDINYFLQVAPFTEDVAASTTGQKYNFYAQLYDNNYYVSAGTPLRLSLAQIGGYYANKLSGQTDPMTAACQRNYAVMTTDGYWNDDVLPTGLAKTGTGSIIGNTDGSPEVRPMLDGLNSDSTLADVAEYFYVTDIRDAALWGNCPTGTDVCTNDITASTDIGTAGRQNMVTYTVGLGVGGTLNYTKDYNSQTTGDFAAIKAGTQNWPQPLLENATRVDDLWHAAVNGRGLYSGAQSASELTTALESTVGKLVQTEGSGSGVAVSAFQLSSSDSNLVYEGNYISGRWVGELTAYAIASDGTVATTGTWTAQAQLDTLANRNSRTAPATGVTSPQCLSLYSNCNDERVIYFMHPSSKALKAFTYAELQSAGLDSDGKFTTSCGRSTDPLSQCAVLSSAQRNLANTGKNLVNYLRGDITYEASNGGNPLYRLRYAALGDIANGTPAYAGKPPFNYSDSGYSDFVSAQSSRTKVVYVAANDGMLHAFHALTGKELWAFVPNAVMPNLYKLADKNYSHQYSVDGSPVIADIEVGGSWKTILVGGLNKGGKAYYALDVSDPAAPIPLWEYTHTLLGYSYGNPVVTKNRAGDWVVAFGSGYNNSGTGHLFVLDAYSGAAKSGSPISTATGSATTPSGLAPINAWVDASKDNTAQRIYGGDLLGNVWRFNIDAGTVAPVATLMVSSTTPQPITVKPQLGSVSHGGTTYPVVMVGTGRYLHSTDVSDKSLQTIYAIKDKLDTTGWGDIRAGGKLVSKSVTTAGSGTSLTRTATSSAQVDWANKAGWMLDLRPSSNDTLEGERVSTNMAIAYSTLVVATNIPSSTSSCRATGGSAWLYYLSLADGYTEIAPMYQGNTMISGVSVVYDRTGKAIVLTKTTDGDTVRQANSPTSPAASTGGLKRVSWRELVN